MSWTRGKNGRLTKRAGVLRVEGRRKRGRARLRWEDCVKRDLEGVGEVEKESEGWGGESEGWGVWERGMGGWDGWWRRL